MRRALWTNVGSHEPVDQEWLEKPDDKIFVNFTLYKIVAQLEVALCSPQPFLNA